MTLSITTIAQGFLRKNRNYITISVLIYLGHTKLIPSLPSFFFKVIRAGGILFYFLFFSHQKSYSINILNLGFRHPVLNKRGKQIVFKGD